MMPIADDTLDALGDDDLARQQADEQRRSKAIRLQIQDLHDQWQRHEARWRKLAREALRRSFCSSPFGRVLVDMVLSFLDAADAVHWTAASPATTAQVSGSAPWGSMGGGSLTSSIRLCRVHHLRRISPSLSCRQARSLAGRICWPSVRTAAIDLSSPGWARVLAALGQRHQGNAPGASCVPGDGFEGDSPDSQRPVEGEETEPSPCADDAACQAELRGLAGLSVAFSTERSAANLRQWNESAPLLAQFGGLLTNAPLQELVLSELRSADVLSVAFRNCGKHLRICRASFVGPDCRRRPLEIPREGLPALECLLIRHRDFCEQRASRQDRMILPAKSLLSCLQSIRRPEGLRILALSGIHVDGDPKEVAAALGILPAFTELVAMVLRMSMPAMFGSLLTAAALVRMRTSWPKLGYFALGSSSIHGFDYIPEQMTDFKQLYGRSSAPEPQEVFRNEFGHTFSAQFNTTAEARWAVLSKEQLDFWAGVAKQLPKLPHSELRRRAATLFRSNF